MGLSGLTVRTAPTTNSFPCYRHDNPHMTQDISFTALSMLCVYIRMYILCICTSLGENN